MADSYDWLFNPPEEREDTFRRETSFRRVPLSERIAGIRAEQDVDVGFGERAADVAMRGLRGVGALLSPLQLPQDILFSVLEGIYSEEESVWDNFREMEWGKYTPWTEAPKRVATGRSILESMGVMDEQVAQYGGIALDLALDPLLMGAYLRGVSKAAGGVDGLMRAADRVDDVTQSILLAGGVPTARSVRQVTNIVGRPSAIGTESTAAGILTGRLDGVRAAWKADTEVANAVKTRTQQLYADLLTPEVRSFVQTRMDEVAKVSVGVSNWLRYQPITLPGGRVTTPAGLFMVDAGRDPNLVRELSRVEFEAGETPGEVVSVITRLMANQGDERAKQLIEQMNRTQTVHFRDIPKRLAEADVSLPTLRNVHRAAYGVVGQTSPLMGLSEEAITSMGVAGEFVAETRRLLRSRQALREATAESFPAQRNLFDEQMAAVREFAVRNGDDPDIAAGLLRATVDDIMKSDAMLGYQTSMLPYVREEAIAQPIRWLENLKETDPRFAELDNVWSRQAQQDWAAKIWRKGIESGLLGKLDEFYSQSFPIPRSIARQLRIPETQRVANAFTGRQSFELLETLTEGALKPQAYFNSLMDGHLRRSFGMFNNAESYESMLRQMERGRVVLKNVVDEAVVAEGSTLMQDLPAITESVQRFFKLSTPVSRDGRQFGVALGQKELKEYLLREGFGADDINLWFERFMREVDDSETVGEVLSNVRRFMEERYGPRIGQGADPRLPMGVSGGAFRQRNMELDAPFLDALNEGLDPFVAAFESASAAQRVVSQKRQLQKIMEYASANPLLVYRGKGAKPKGFIRISSKQRDIYGDLAGTEVHPMLYRELNNLMAKAKRPNEFVRGAAMLRSMVTGGYLANPATTTTNVLGGFFTAFLYGQNPVSLASEMLGAYRDLRAGNLDDFRAVGPLLGDTLSQADILRVAPELKAQQFIDERSAVDGMKALANSLYSGYQQYVVRKPLGIGALGLEPFEISENLFRVAAYRQALKRGLNQDEAYDYARFMVFDYGAQPDAIKAMRDTGLILFPSFPAFMIGRTLNAAWSRPGVLAASDRVSEAVWNANVATEEEQLALWGGMNDWMRRDQYVPLWPINDPDGNRVGWQFLPLGQMLMTNGLSGLTGDFVTEQLEQGGLWGPLYDVVSSLAAWDESDGTATYGQRFGRQVWTPSANNAEKLQGLAKFIYESFAPGFARKLVMPGGVGEPAGGLIPSLARNVFTLPGSAGENAQAMMDAYGRMPDRGLAAEAFTTFIRSTRAVTQGGVQGQNIRQPMRSLRFEFEEKLRDLRERRSAAVRRGDMDEADALLARIEELREEFVREYGPYQDLASAANRVFGGNR